jgi:hypothetical protein
MVYGWEYAIIRSVVCIEEKVDREHVDQGKVKSGRIVQ